VPLDWAATQSSLGGALWILGKRESGTEHLTEAVAAFDAGLTAGESVWPPERLNLIRVLRDKIQAEIDRRVGK
jgi:hypothetical protein